MQSNYSRDVARFAELVHSFTGVPKGDVNDHIFNYGVSGLLSGANALCKDEPQRSKLSHIMEFNGLAELLKGSDSLRAKYTFESTKSACEYFIRFFSWKADREYFAAAFLDAQNTLIVTKILSSGTVNEAHIFPREVVKEALFHNASNVVFAHNHPGGGLTPSKADVGATALLMDTLQRVGVKVVDHIIVANDNIAVSFAENGLLKYTNEKLPARTDRRKKHKRKIPANIRPVLAAEPDGLKYHAVRKVRDWQFLGFTGNRQSGTFS